MSTGALILIGGGGHAKVVLDAARLLGFQIAGVHDENPRAAVCEMGVEYLGTIDDWCVSESVVSIIAVGDLNIRRRCISRIDGRGVCPALIHPDAIVSPSARLGRGVFVGAGAIVHAGSRIGEHCILNTGSIVEHDCVLGSNTHLAPRATLGGGVEIGAETLVGLGASIRPGQQIGSGCTVGVGAVVVDDIADGACVVGNPARGIATRIRF